EKATKTDQKRHKNDPKTTPKRPRWSPVDPCPLTTSNARPRPRASQPTDTLDRRGKFAPNGRCPAATAGARLVQNSMARSRLMNPLLKLGAARVVGVGEGFQFGADEFQIEGSRIGREQVPDVRFVLRSHGHELHHQQ